MNIQVYTLNWFFSLPPNNQRNLSLDFTRDASISKIRRLHSAMVISTTHIVNSGSHCLNKSTNQQQVTAPAHVVSSCAYARVTCENQALKYSLCGLV